MTETKARALEEVREDLERAQGAQAAIEAELWRLPETLREAAGGEEADLAKLALEGKSPPERSAYARAMDRRDELPGLLWATKLRVKRLQRELGLLRVRAELNTLVATRVNICPTPPIELTRRVGSHIPDLNDAPGLAGAVPARADLLVTNDGAGFENLYETVVEGVLRPKGAFDRVLVGDDVVG